jgi:serine/threonine-protein kinase RsbT
MGELSVPIRAHHDVVHARQLGRERARELGFGRADQTRLATAISELARNIIIYAGSGSCVIRDETPDFSYVRLIVVMEDSGPGILDIEQAMQDGFTTGSGLGAGLPAVKRLVHEFHIESVPGHTCITIAIRRRRSDI